MKILRLLAPILLLAATAFGQVTMQQPSGSFTDKGIPRRNGPHNVYADTTVLITDTNGIFVPGTITSSSLTTGRVPFIGTSGLITDSASLTFNSGTGALTATSFVGSGAGITGVSTPLTPTGVKTSAYTAVANDFIPVDTTSGAITVTLPTAPANKTQIGVKMVIQGGTNAITLAAGGADVFNKSGGPTTFQINLVNQTTTLQYSSGIWYVISDTLPRASLLAFANTWSGQQTFVAPILGAATGTSINGNIFTAGTYTLTGAAAKTLAFSNSLTLAGTDGSTLNVGAGGTLGSNAFNSTSYQPLSTNLTTIGALANAAGVLTNNGSGGFSYVAPSTGTVTSVGFTGGLISVATPTTTPALTVAGTSGGIPFFSSSSTWGTSAALAANSIVLGGGAGTAPATTTTGTGVVTALGVNTGTAGSFIVNGGVLGTPSSGTVTNLTGTASININGTVGATTPASGSFTTIAGSGAGTFTGAVPQLSLGVNAATNGGIKMFGNTSGDATISPLAVAGTSTALTLPAASGGLIASSTAIATVTGAPSSSNFLRGDGTWAVPAGTGTVTVVAAGSLTSTALVTGGGTTTLQTPSATATLDSSGNISTPGTISVGSGATTAGSLSLTQGTTQSTGTTNITIQAPTAVTSYVRTLDGSAGSTGVYLGTVSGTTVTDTKVAAGTTGNVLTSNGTTWTSAAPAAGGSVPPINAQTGTTYTAALTDAPATSLSQGFVTMSNASANTLTVPLNATVAFPLGTQIAVQRLGAGSTTIAATGGVTINSPSGLSIANQYGWGTLLKTGTDTWQFSSGPSVVVASGKTLTANNSLTLAGTDATTMTFPATSASIARTDAAQTFTGTQTFGAVVGTTWNGNTWAAGTGTLSIGAGKTVTQNNSVTYSGTDGTTMTFPTTSATLARTDAANTFTGTQTFGAVVGTTWNGNTFTAGTYTLTGTAAKTLNFTNSLTLAGTDSTTMTFPATSATIARTDAANTFTGASSTTSWAETTPVITGGLTASGAGANTFAGSTGTFLTSTGVVTLGGGVNAVTLSGPAAATATARSSGVANYFTVNIPADTGITAATEAIGYQHVTGTRTWATTGTVALQRENFFAGPTYASASASQTFTDAFNSYFTPPVAGTNAIFTRGHSVGIVDATSAASSITGGLVVATTLGTSATSVGIGGGNVNAGGLITGGTITSTGTFTASGASTHTGAATFNNAVTVNGAAATTALTITNTARTSGVLPYIKYTIPTDTAQTAATESPGIQGVTGTRTWATNGTVALQREIFFPGPTYASASASQTFTDAFNMYLTPPIAGTNAIFTRGHSLGIVDSTSAASSVTGGLVVATTLGTTATSVGIGGGNINAGGSGTFGGQLIGGGTTTNNAAAAGVIGETATTTVSSGSAVSLTTATAANMTSVSLTAGDWDVYATFVFSPAATTSVTQLTASIGTTTGAITAITGGTMATTQQSYAAMIPVNPITITVGPLRQSLSGTTTVFAVGQSSFTVSTMSEYGSIYARRVR